MKSPRWVDVPQSSGDCTSSVCDDDVGPPALPAPSTEPQSTPEIGSGRSVSLLVETPSVCARLSPPENSPSSLAVDAVRISPRPKKVTFHPDTEDNWMWGALPVPKLSEQDRETLKAECWSDERDDTAAQPDKPSKPHLTYQEPAPHPEEGTPSDDEPASFDTLIIITSPTGKDCVYGVTPEVAARIQIDLMSANAKLVGFKQPTTSLKRKVEDSCDEQYEQLERKRTVSSRGGTPTGEATVVACASPTAGRSAPLKRKAEEFLHEPSDGPIRKHDSALAGVS